MSGDIAITALVNEQQFPGSGELKYEEFLQLVKEWEEAKEEAARARAKERALRDKLIDKSPRFTKKGDKTGYEELPDGRLMCARNSYNYKVANEHEFMVFYDSLPQEYKGIIRYKAEFVKSKIKELPTHLRERFDELVIRTQASTQISFMPAEMRKRMSSQG